MGLKKIQGKTKANILAGLVEYTVRGLSHDKQQVAGGKWGGGETAKRNRKTTKNRKVSVESGDLTRCRGVKKVYEEGLLCVREPRKKRKLKKGESLIYEVGRKAKRKRKRES